MGLTSPTEYVKSRQQIYNLTHFICFPLITSSSRPPLKSSLRLLQDNPASVGIPRKAFVPIDMLQLNAGIAMSLPTQDRLAKAVDLLRSLDLNSLTRELSKPSVKERSIKERFLDVERSLSLSSAAPMNQPLPLKVTLSGLAAASPGQDVMVRTLLAQCRDPTSRVGHLMNNLAVIFEAAGLFDLSSERRWNRIHLRTMSPPLARVPLIKTSLIRRKRVIPSLNQPGKVQMDTPPTIDSRDLVRIFKDFVWADSIRLERVIICSLGITTHIRDVGSDAQLSEACSVSLI